MNKLISSLVVGLIAAQNLFAQEAQSNTDPSVSSDTQTPAVALRDWDADERDFSESLARVKQQLKLLPIGQEAKRLTVEGLMLATVVKDTATADQWKRELLEHYPYSVEAAYVMTSFTDVKLLRTFLFQQFLKDLSTIDKSVQAVRVIRMAFPHHKKGLLEDPPFALRLTCAAFVVGDRGTCNECRSVLKDKFGQVASIACDDLVPLVERFRELQLLAVNNEFETQARDINLLQRRLFQLMTTEEQFLPDIQRSLARNCLVNNELELALTQFELLSEAQDDAQFLFQHAACLARLRRTEDARGKLQRLKSKYPDSEWCKSADVVLRELENLDAKLDHYAETLANSFAAYRQTSIEICDLDVNLKPKRGEALRITLGVDVKQNFFEIIASRQETVLIAVKCHGEETTFYLQNEPVIYHMPRMSMLPSASMAGCEINSKGEFHGQTSFGTGKSLDSFQTTIRAALSNDKLCSRAAMKLLIGGLIRSGFFLLPYQENDGKGTCQFLRPDIDKPEIYVSAIHFDKRHFIESARFEFMDSFIEIGKLVLGSRKEHALVSGTWPDLPIKTLKDNEGGTFMRLAGTAMALFLNGAKPDSTADSSSLRANPQR